ncbi:MAG: hypothetical protein U1E56_00505 [Bauldia sp.]
MAANRDVFINCPFDDLYAPIFNAIVFTVIRAGFRARCAREADDGGQVRLAKIAEIIDQCRFAVHDISRTESDGDPPLPRFNMPLELGLFLGVRLLGTAKQKAKRCLILDREPYRYQRFISDIAGQDIHAHRGDPNVAIGELAAWLRIQSPRRPVPGGQQLARDFEGFQARLPQICRERALEPGELTFGDYVAIATEYALDAA